MDSTSSKSTETEVRVTRESVSWAFRFFIGRDPVSEDELAFHLQHPTLETLRKAFSESREFGQYQRDLRGPEPYRVPMFLLQRPADLKLRWEYGPPLLSRPVSQLCTSSQFSEPVALRLSGLMRFPLKPHRKLWEYCYILAVLEPLMLRGGVRGLGFGVGREPLPAVLAAHGVAVTATDAPTDLPAAKAWDLSGQHATDLADLDFPGIVSFRRLRRQVAFRSVDMNAIPDDLRGYDFCWSSGALEHLGSLADGLRFVEKSMETLRPGGWAVHTTGGFNLSSNVETVDTPSLAIHRKRDMEELASRLRAAGHDVQPLNFHPGSAEMDDYIDHPPYEIHPLKIEEEKYVITSFGLAVRKGS